MLVGTDVFYVLPGAGSFSISSHSPSSLLLDFFALLALLGFALGGELDGLLSVIVN